MSLDIGDLVGYIKFDHSNVGRDIQAAQAKVRQGMTGVQAEARRGGEKAGKEAGDGVRKGISGVAADIRSELGKAFAVGAAIAGLAKLKDAASDLNETSSMAGVIFGRNAKAMEAWAGNAPRTLGLAREEALRLSASFADMFQQIGYTGDAATSTSREVLQMAADLGSFKNLETADVLERISAGFRGEYDSLQLLIPNISAARVQQEAMTATGKANAEALTAQEKAAATLAIIQKDGARAMGDFARTADGAANAEKTAMAQTKDLAAQLGQALLPAWIAVVTFGRDQALPFLASAVDHMGDVADAAAPVAHGLGQVVDMFKAMPAEAQAATVSLVAFLALRSRLEDFGTGLKTRIGDGARSAGGALDTLRLHLMYASDEAQTGSTKLGGYARAIGTTAGQGLRGAASGLLGVLGGPWGVAFAAGAAAVAFWAGKQQEAKAFTDDLKSSLDAQTGAVTENTRVKVAQKLQEEGLLERAKALGVSLEDVTAAATGNTDAMERLRRMQADLQSQADAAAGSSTAMAEALIQGSSGAGVLEQATGDATEKLGAQANQLDRLLQLIAPYNAALAREGEKTAEVAQAAGTATDSTEDLGGAMSDTKDDLKDAEKAAKDAAQAVLDLHDAQLAASGAQISYQDALAGVQERLDKRKELEKELAEAQSRKVDVDKKTGKADPEDVKRKADEVARIKDELADYAKTLDVTTEAGRRNRDALNEQAESATRQAEAQLKAGGSLKDTRAAMDEARETFVENARRLGASRKEAEKMADQFGLTKDSVDNIAKAVGDLPASKEIKIEADTKAANARLLALQGRINGLAGKTVSVVVDEVHNTRYVQSGQMGKAGGRGTAGGLTINEADGGVLKFYADGAHVAQHVPAGSWRVFGEPETGGETYIPHAISKRPRSTAILAETAAMFGYNLQPKSETRINRTSVLHTGNIYTDSPQGYLDDVAGLLEH